MRSSALREVAEGVVPKSLISHVPRGFEVVGDIAIVNIPRQLENYRFELAEALLSRFKGRMRIVVRRVSPARDPNRVHSYEVLAGSGGLETIHRESGCTFKVDLSKVFFTSRLQYERIRVARAVRRGEVVVNMFAGVGPFSIVIAKLVQDVKVYSIDINPDAYKLMVENIRLNKVEDKVIPILGDAGEAIDEHGLRGVADRVLMPSPEHAFNYLAKAVEALKPQGFIHYYDVANPKVSLYDHLNLRVREGLRGLEVRWVMRGVRAIRSVAPLKVYACADLEVERATSRP